MKRLCTLCARGGSKGVKNKNVRVLGGKPLIAHSILQARDSGLFDAIAVSSDDADILEAAREWGADHLVERPAELATDSAAKMPAIRHCVKTVMDLTGTDFDTFVDLDATAPLRIAKDIEGAVALLENSDADNVITGTPARRSPYFNLVECDSRGRVHLSKPSEQAVVRRQDCPPCYDLNASIYVWHRAALFADYETVIGANTLLFEMPEERSVDIDSELDFQFVAFLLA